MVYNSCGKCSKAQIIPIFLKEQCDDDITSNKLSYHTKGNFLCQESTQKKTPKKVTFTMGSYTFDTHFTRYQTVLYRKETKRLHQKLKYLMEKTQNRFFFFLNWSRTGADSSLEISMKQFLQRYESNQNKSKQMKINDVFDCFTSKA